MSELICSACGYAIYPGEHRDYRGTHISHRADTGHCVEILKARVAELLETNNRDLERRRAAESVLTLAKLQDDQREWVRRNFGDRPYWHPLLGAVEELGELAHACLKGEQGIRGTVEEHDAKAKDAVADTIIYLADFCTARGYDLQQIVAETWARVKQRDWTVNKQTGGSGDLSLAQTERGAA
jgi:NTP pyrophosphatase (non-canonical NTP hydrolase)